jgi:hypothetical protein
MTRKIKRRNMIQQWHGLQPEPRRELRHPRRRKGLEQYT